VKIWTRGRNGRSAPTRRHSENVAYVITGHNGWAQEAQFAARTALCRGARFHLLHLTPIQEIHEGTLAADIRIGHPNVSTCELIRLISSLPLRPVVHSSTGDEIREMPRLLRECAADIVFPRRRISLAPRPLRVLDQPGPGKTGLRSRMLPQASGRPGRHCPSGAPEPRSAADVWPVNTRV
jgi:hypothetical protein